MKEVEEFADIVRKLELASIYGIQRKPNESDEELRERVRLAAEKLKLQDFE